MSDEPPEVPVWADVKLDIWALVVTHLHSRDKRAFQLVCHQWLKCASKSSQLRKHTSNGLDKVAPLGQLLELLMILLLCRSFFHTSCCTT